jgi:hypothetical protein
MRSIDLTIEIPDDLEFVLNSILHYRKMKMLQFIVETIHKELEYWEERIQTLFSD